MDNIPALPPRHARELVDAAERSVREALRLFKDHPDWKDDSGGYFCVADAGTGTPLVIALVGSVPPEKVEKYLSFCQEKARRLAAHTEHETSFESRDPDANQWGGAVRGYNLIFSFSGLPELGDEAVMLGVELITCAVGGTPEVLRDIAAKNHNDYWKPLSLTLST